MCWLPVEDMMMTVNPAKEELNFIPKLFPRLSLLFHVDLIEEVPEVATTNPAPDRLKQGAGKTSTHRHSDTQTAFRFSDINDNTIENGPESSYWQRDVLVIPVQRAPADSHGKPRALFLFGKLHLECASSLFVVCLCML